MATSGIGAVAQMGERLVRNEEVRGSIPLGSTNPSPFRCPIGTLNLPAKLGLEPLVRAILPACTSTCRYGRAVSGGAGGHKPH